MIVRPAHNMTLKSFLRPTGSVIPTRQPVTSVAYATDAPERPGGLTWCYAPRRHRV